jgi:hypothetical protein
MVHPFAAAAGPTSRPEPRTLLGLVKNSRLRPSGFDGLRSARRSACAKAGDPTYGRISSFARSTVAFGVA